MALGKGNLLGHSAAKFGHIDQAVVQALPAVALPLVRTRYRMRGKATDELDAFIDTIRSADLVLASGGGYITDEFAKVTEGVSRVLSVAHSLGKPTAMLGQGLGPLDKPRLQAIARRGMRHLGLLSVRERLKSPAVAERLGIRSSRVRVTGDDTIELAWSLRPETPGSAIGLNIRTAAYAAVNKGELDALSDALARLLRRLDTSVRILPISLWNNEDIRSAAALLPEGMETLPDGLYEPEDVIRLAGECRIVITGSYHAAVFALAQGIPAVCLLKSPYYRDKFEGLADMFGAGCVCIAMDAPGFDTTLESAALDLWQKADELRAPLLSRAEYQIGCARDAYSRLRDLI